jgi:thioredoxin 1
MIPQSDKPVLVDFYATWCAPCQWLEPILADLETRLEGRINILKIDIDEHPGIAQQFNVQSVPTLALFKSGELKWRMAGFQLAPELARTLEEYL